jgi:hypothetical protein
LLRSVWVFMMHRLPLKEVVGVFVRFRAPFTHKAETSTAVCYWHNQQEQHYQTETAQQ